MAVPRDPLNLVGEVLLKRYRIQEYLGGGGFGFVYRAYDHDLKDEMALKFPKDSSVNQEIIREAQILHKLDKRSTSGHIVRFYTLVEIDGRQTLVTEFCKGGSLDERISKGRQRRSARSPLPASLACQVVTQVCSGLEEAHALNCVHRDIKPDNIFLSERTPGGGVAKLGDFGIARILATGGKTRIGTKCYMAPEILSGDGADLRSDVYSLGVTLYELLTGSMPYDRSLPDFLLMKAIVEGDVTPISSFSHVDPRLQTIVEKAMNVVPGARYQSAADLGSAMEGVQVDLAVEAELAELSHPHPGDSVQPQVEANLAELCRRFPKSRRPYLELARVLRRRGLAPRAVEVYLQAISHMGPDRILLYLLAQNYAAIGRYYWAIGTMEQALDNDFRKQKGPATCLSAKEIEVGRTLLLAWRKLAPRDTGR